MVPRPLQKLGGDSPPCVHTYAFTLGAYALTLGVYASIHKCMHYLLAFWKLDLKNGYWA